MVIEQKEEGLSVLLEGELGHHEALSALRSLEDAISEKMLEGEIKAGDTVTVDVKDDKFTCQTNHASEASQTAQA